MYPDRSRFTLPPSQPTQLHPRQPVKKKVLGKKCEQPKKVRKVPFACLFITFCGWSSIAKQVAIRCWLSMLSTPWAPPKTRNLCHGSPAELGSYHARQMNWKDDVAMQHVCCRLVSHAMCSDWSWMKHLLPFIWSKTECFQHLSTKAANPRSLQNRLLQFWITLSQLVSPPQFDALKNQIWGSVVCRNTL